MKTSLPRLTAIVAVALMAAMSITSCNPKEDPEVAVSSVSVSQSSLTLEPGGTANLTATVSPSNATDKTVTWSTSNQSVATVSGGTVTAVGEGTATITATAGGRTASCTVTVNKKVTAVSTVTLDKTEEELEPGATLTLSATVKPDDATDKTVTWSSSDDKVATVKDGTVTAVAAGTATITAKAGSKEATCKVTVKKDVESIELDKTETELETGETYTLIATVIPDDATYTTVEWTTSDANIATVENGKITAMAEGTATITAKAGDKTAACVVTVGPRVLDIARSMMEKVYEAWGAKDWKEAWIPGDTWPGLSYDPVTKKIEIWLNDVGAKGPVPDCIGDFGDMLSVFVLINAPDVTGTLPDSFRKLTGLEQIFIQSTGMTSVPEVFADMKQLKVLDFNVNHSLTGPLPASIDSPVLEELFFSQNNFTGTIPDSWAPYVGSMTVDNNRLTGEISRLFSKREEIKAFVEKGNLWQQKGYGFDISDLEIPGYRNWFEGRLLENLDGTTFSIPEVVSKNKYTVYVYWATWCPFSKELMPQLKAYYDKYKQDGLEVIATIQVEEGGSGLFYDYDKQKKECIEKGYDGWYNFYWTKYETSYFMAVPLAEVYDQQGNVIFSSCADYPDPVRNRFGRTASSELIPFLETLLGPAEEPDLYESTDYSKDGEVLTLQKASVGKGINIVFLGDGYTDKDMASGGLYETVMKQAMEEFFAEEPYKSFRKRFNVYAVKAVSKNGRVGEGYSTALSTTHGSGSYIEGNDDKCLEYALKVPGITSRNDLLVTVLANSNRHAGTTFMYSGQQTCVAYLPSMGNDPEVFGSTVRHEAGGHGFAFLADEYSQYEGTAPAEHITYYNEVYSKFGWFSNVDFTDDPSKIRWSAFLSDDRYKDEVGIYEGGALYGKGAWRPTLNSIMKNDYGGFNAPSRWAIYQQIMKRSGEECTFEKFLEYDAVNRGKKQSSAPVTRSTAIWQHTAPPVIIP